MNRQAVDRVVAVIVGLFAGGAVLIGVLGAVADDPTAWPLTFVGAVGSVVVGVAVGSWFATLRR